MNRSRARRSALSARFHERGSRAVVVVLIALGLVATVSAVVAAAPAVAAPTITFTPANPTSVTTASFSFTGPSGATFQCQLDTAAYAPCTSPKAYTTTLTQGVHVFQVRSVKSGVLSAATSYTWTVDSVAPPAPSLTAKPASLSTSANATFSFTDSEAGVTFRCSLDASAYTACSSSRTYTALAQGAHTFSVQAVDAAGNVSGSTSLPWTIDSIAPPAPVLTKMPSDPTSGSSVTFEWTGTQAGVTFQCSVENGAWTACATPYTYTIGTVNNQQHQFGVRALDTAGNISGGAFYQFKYVTGSTSGVPFTITGGVGGLPIGVWKPIAITLTNPNAVTIYVTALSVAMASPNEPTVCPATDNLELQQSNVSSTLRVAVPANSSVQLPAASVTAPQIRLKNLATVNQDACKSRTFALTYSGSATN